MRRPTPLPEPLSRGPFRYAEAVSAGVARSRLRLSDVSHPHRGVYSPAPAVADLAVRCEQLAFLLGEHQWFSHTTAARLWGMPLPAWPTADEPLHVISLADAAPMRRPGVIGWETQDDRVPREMLGLLPVVAPAEVWCQLAVPGAAGRDPDTGRRRCLSDDWLTAAGDYLVSGPRRHGTRHPLCSLDDLRAAVARQRGKRGARALAVAIEQVRSPVDSSQETLLRLGLIAHGLPEPVVQFPVMTSMGERHADLGYPDARVLLEYQGDQHRTDRRQWLQDLTRLQLFEEAGYRMILVGADNMGPGMPALASRVRRALRAAKGDH